MSINSNLPARGQRAALLSTPVVEAVDQQPTARNVSNNEILYAILLELRVMNLQLREGFSLKDDTESLRVDESIYLN